MCFLLTLLGGFFDFFFSVFRPLELCWYNVGFFKGVLGFKESILVIILYRLLAICFPFSNSFLLWLVGQIFCHKTDTWVNMAHRGAEAWKSNDLNSYRNEITQYYFLRCVKLVYNRASSFLGMWQLTWKILLVEYKWNERNPAWFSSLRKNGGETHLTHFLNFNQCCWWRQNLWAPWPHHSLVRAE